MTAVSTIRNKFLGYKATHMGRPCFVVNEGISKDGCRLLKIKIGTYSRFYGDHAPRRDVNYSADAKWVKAIDVCKSSF